MSRLLGWSCCALFAFASIAWSSSESLGQEKRIVARLAVKPHSPTYDYVPVSGSVSNSFGYCGPVNYGTSGGPACAGCNCTGPDEAEAAITDAADCGCGGCDGSCGCGPGNCNCGTFSDGGVGCGCGPAECSPCDTGCGPCDYGCAPCGECCCSDCDVVYDCVPQCCGPRFTMWGDFLYLQVTDADVAHAQQQDGLGGAGTVPFGEIGTIGQNFNPGWRVGGSIACGPCTSVGISYTQFESDSFASLEAPSSASTGAVGSLVHHPGAALTASAGPVDATYEVDFQLADVMWRRIGKQSERYTFAYSVGAEYGRLEQDFSQSGIFGGGLGGAIDTDTSIDFDGGGIKIGVDGDHTFGHGCGIYGRLTAAALTGRFRSHYNMFNESTDQMLAQADWDDDRVIGHVEYEVGASLISMNHHWRISAGYMFSYWTNVVTTPAFIDAVQADNYTNVGDTIGFNGLVGRIECLW